MGLSGLTGISGVLIAYIFAVVLTVQAAPVLIAVANALLPVVLVAAVAVALLRLLFIHTRRW
jgi:hypothetical protein